MRRLLLLLVTAAAVSTALAATGSAAAAPSRTGPLETAAGAAGKASSYSYKLAMTLSSPGAPTPLTINVTGIAQRSPQTVQMTMDMTELMAASGAPAAYGRYTMIKTTTASGPVFYLSGGVFKQLLTAGRTWAKVNGTAYAKAAGGDLAKQLSNGADIGSFLDVLKAAGAAVTEVGKEKVGTTAATRYKVVVGVDRMLAAQGASAADAAKQTANYRTKTVTYAVWLDGKERPVRMKLSLPIQSSGQKIDEEIDMTIGDYGSAKRIDVPADSLAKDITAALAANAKKSAG